MAPSWGGVDSAVEGSLGNWAGFISLGIPPFWALCAVSSPPDSSFYIRPIGRTVLLHLQAPESRRNPKFLLSLHEPKMPPELWASQLRQRKQRPKIFLSFNWARKRTLLLRPGIVGGADCVRSLMNLQAPTSSSSSLPVPSVWVWLLLERDCESTITTSLLPFIASFEASLPRLFCS